MRLRPLFLTAAGLMFLTMTSCAAYSTKGGWLPSSNSTFTYISTTSSPKTIRIIDTRNDEAFFSLRLPVGKQLTFKFMDAKGDDPIYTPDRMLWEIWDAPHKNGKLSNQLTVHPPAHGASGSRSDPLPSGRRMTSGIGFGLISKKIARITGHPRVARSPIRAVPGRIDVHSRMIRVKNITTAHRSGGRSFVCLQSKHEQIHLAEATRRRNASPLAS